MTLRFSIVCIVIDVDHLYCFIWHWTYLEVTFDDMYIWKAAIATERKLFYKSLINFDFSLLYWLLSLKLINRLQVKMHFSFSHFSHCRQDCSILLLQTLWTVIFIAFLPGNNSLNLQDMIHLPRSVRRLFLNSEYLILSSSYLSNIWMEYRTTTKSENSLQPSYWKTAVLLSFLPQSGLIKDIFMRYLHSKDRVLIVVCITGIF